MFFVCTHAHTSVSLLPALLDCVSSQQRVNNRVNGLLEVLNKDSVSCNYRLFYHIYITGKIFDIKRLKWKKNIYTNNISSLRLGKKWDG